MSWYNNSSSTCSFTIPHKTLAYTAETTQVLYFGFTKATVLVSLPLDLITLLAPALSGSVLPDILDVRKMNKHEISELREQPATE